jgi:hypothetical protein
MCLAGWIELPAPVRPLRNGAAIRMTEQAERLRKEAQGTQPGVQRDKLIRQARQLETASHMQDWLASPGLKGPR